MISIQDLRVFTEIVQENSFAAAAAKLGLSPATASGRLKALEECFGLCLINRTTRSLKLTDEGYLLFERSKPLLSQFDSLEKQLSERRTTVAGPISISSPAEFGRNQILPLINEFSELYPEVEFKIILEDVCRLRSDDECDLMIRFGTLPNCALTTRKLSRNPILTVASPKYIDVHGSPNSFKELENHNCILLKGESAISGDWKFFADGEHVSIPVLGNKSVNDVGALLDLAAAGCGIVQATYWDVCDLLESGQLQSILDFERPPELLVSLVSESREKLPIRTQMFIDFLVQNMRSYGDAVLGEPETKLRLVSG